MAQQIDDLAALQIAQNGTVTMLFSRCPVVDAKHPRNGDRCKLDSLLKLSQRRAADQQDKPAAETSFGLPFQSKRDLVQRFG